MIGSSLLAFAALSSLAAPTPVLIASPDGDVVRIDTHLGKGDAIVAEGDIVTIGYKGWVQSTGKVFDESRNRPPFAFRVGSDQAIKGMSIGLAGMKVGGKRILCIPPVLGYGDTPMGDIAPNSTLLFDVELYRIDKPGIDATVETMDLNKGTGKAAAAGDIVEIHYTGTFMNGVKFDSSRDRKESFAFELGAKRVIAGFDLGVMGMQIGGKRKITIPYNLAYGPDGREPVIPKFATLVFDIELLKIR